MLKFKIVGETLCAIGHCAMAGTLIVLLTTQAFAESAPASIPQSGVQPGGAFIAGNVSALETNASSTPNVSIVAPESAQSVPSVLPDAPDATADVARVILPIDLNAMGAAAAQNNSQTPTTNNKKIQRPGMLIMGCIGIPLTVVGVLILSLKVGPKATGEKDGLGAAFLAPGAVMMGAGFYFAFHKKS